MATLQFEVIIFSSGMVSNWRWLKNSELLGSPPVRVSIIIKGRNPQYGLRPLLL